VSTSPLTRLTRSCTSSAPLAAREAAGLTLAGVSARCGIDQPALSRLENGHTPNPTPHPDPPPASGEGEGGGALRRGAGQTLGAGGGRIAGYTGRGANGGRAVVKK